MSDFDKDSRNDKIEERKQIFFAVTQFLNRCGTDWLREKQNSDDDFLSLSIAVLKYQYRRHAGIVDYCNGKNFDNARSILDFEPIPTDLFKNPSFGEVPENEAVATFYSSGTTKKDRGIHRFRDVGLMQRAIFNAFIPMTCKSPANMRYYSLMPSFEQFPNSSLAYMLTQFCLFMNTEKTPYFTDPEAGLDVDALCRTLEKNQNDNIPIHLMGPAFSFVHLIDALGKRRFRLHPDSRLLETGGYKGKSREMPKDELRDTLSEKLGIARGNIYGEYGMSEMSSQFYELSSCTTVPFPESLRSLFVPPEWVKFFILDPDTLEEVPDGEWGQIAVFDLCNLDSAAFLLTGDIGRAVVGPHKNPLKRLLCLKGRSENAAPKGCSMMWENIGE